MFGGPGSVWEEPMMGVVSSYALQIAKSNNAPHGMFVCAEQPVGYKAEKHSCH